MGPEGDGDAGGRAAGRSGPPPGIRRKLRMLAIPAAMVLILGVALLGIYYSTPKPERSDLLFYTATALTFGSLLVLFPVAKVYLLWPRDGPRKKRAA